MGHNVIMEERLPSKRSWRLMGALSLLLGGAAAGYASHHHLDRALHRAESELGLTATPHLSLEREEDSYTISVGEKEYPLHITDSGVSVGDNDYLVQQVLARDLNPSSRDHLAEETLDAILANAPQHRELLGDVVREYARADPKGAVASLKEETIINYCQYIIERDSETLFERGKDRMKGWYRGLKEVFD